MSDASIPWTQFHDMSSGGRRKLAWRMIFIQAPEAEAKVVFYNRFGRNPERVTCTCCGEDYSISQSESLEHATGYERACAYRNGNYVEEPDEGYGRKYRTLAEYRKDEGVLIIDAADIKPEEREGDVPEEGYVWR